MWLRTVRGCNCGATRGGGWVKTSLGLGQRLVENNMQQETIKLLLLRTAIKVGLDDFEHGKFTLLKNTRQIESFVREAAQRAAKRARNTPQLSISHIQDST